MQRSEFETGPKVHYLTLELREFLPIDKYKALLACTVDGISQWDAEKRVNVYRINVNKIHEAESVLGKKITITKTVGGEVEGKLEERYTPKLEITYDIRQRILVVIVDGEAHTIPFDYVDFLWSIIKRNAVVKPRQIWESLEERLGLPRSTFYQNRKMYYAHYYWPVVALKALSLIEQSGSGPLELSREAASMKSWVEALLEGV